MAVFAFLNAFISINAIDLTDHATNVSVKMGAVDLLTTNFSSGGWDERIAGLKSGTVSFDFNQDEAASKVDATLWAALGTVVAVKVRLTSAAISATNVEYQFNALINDYTPISGKVGDLAKVTVSFPITGAVTRAVA